MEIMCRAMMRIWHLDSVRQTGRQCSEILKNKIICLKTGESEIKDERVKMLKV